MVAKDDNTRAQEGTLPDDPTADAVPYDAADKVRARIEGAAVAALLPAAMAELKARADGSSKPIGLPAWPHMAEQLGGGLWPGLYTLTGNTGSGKSAFAIDLALQAAQAGHPVLYIALELDELGILARFLAHPRLVEGTDAGLRWSGLYRGQVRDIGRVIRNREPSLGRLPIHILTGDAFGYEPDSMFADARGLLDFYGDDAPRPALVLLDFLQVLAEPAGARMDVRERMTRAAYGGRELARKHGVAVVALSSTAREHYGKLGGTDRDRLGAFPADSLVGLGKESGDIEYASDGVLVIASEPWIGHKPPEGGTRTWLAIAKQRAGTHGWVPMRFDGRCHEEDPDRAPLPPKPKKPKNGDALLGEAMLQHMSGDPTEGIEL